MYCSITNTDIIGNGIGSRGLSRGHSGIYVERGRQTVSLYNCNISHNTTSGICFFFANESLSLFHNTNDLLNDLRTNDNDIHGGDGGDNVHDNNDDDGSENTLHRRRSNNNNQNQNQPSAVIGGAHTAPSSLRQRQQIRFCMNHSSIVLNESEQVQVTAETLQFHVHNHQHHQHQANHHGGRIEDHRTMLQQLFDSTNNQLTLAPPTPPPVSDHDNSNNNDTSIVLPTATPKPRSTILSLLQLDHHHNHHHPTWY